MEKPDVNQKRQVNMYLREEVIEKLDKLAGQWHEPRSRAAERCVEMVWARCCDELEPEETRK